MFVTFFIFSVLLYVLRNFCNTLGIQCFVVRGLVVFVTIGFSVYFCTWFRNFVTFCIFSVLFYVVYKIFKSCNFQCIFVRE